MRLSSSLLWPVFCSSSRSNQCPGKKNCFDRESVRPICFKPNIPLLSFQNNESIKTSQFPGDLNARWSKDRSHLNFRSKILFLFLWYIASPGNCVASLLAPPPFIDLSTVSVSIARCRSTFFKRRRRRWKKNVATLSGQRRRRLEAIKLKLFSSVPDLQKRFVLFRSL